MTAIAPRRKGWCPGALRPMETGDGLLVRVRASAGRLSLDQAAAIADAALACGNGALSLSGRGNVQIRGLSARSLLELRARLDAVGLIDADPEVERLRNIVTSPLDDIDGEAAFDLAPGVASLEKRLAQDARLRRLPGKFSFILDALGRLPLGDIDADIRFEAIPGAGEQAFSVFLAGEDALAATCCAAETGDAAARLAAAFLELAGAGAGEGAARRMRPLVERIGAKAVFAEAGLAARAATRSQRRASLGDLLGAHAFGDAIVVGAAAAFGDIEASRFKALIESARTMRASGLRLTPWRAFLIAGLDPRRAASLVAAGSRLGFILGADDPQLRVVACPGAPACMHAHRPLREDALRWAALLPKGEGLALHVSGCAKGCARAQSTPATLTATATGYDLVLAGRAGDRPTRRGLSPGRVEELLLSEGARIFGGEGRPA
jgi:precorrin-3B synthase